MKCRFYSVRICQGRGHKFSALPRTCSLSIALIGQSYIECLKHLTITRRFPVRIRAFSFLINQHSFMMLLLVSKEDTWLKQNMFCCWFVLVVLEKTHSRCSFRAIFFLRNSNELTSSKTYIYIYITTQLRNVLKNMHFLWNPFSIEQWYPLLFRKWWRWRSVTL